MFKNQNKEVINKYLKIQDKQGVEYKHLYVVLNIIIMKNILHLQRDKLITL